MSAYAAQVPAYAATPKGKGPTDSDTHGSLAPGSSSHLNLRVCVSHSIGSVWGGDAIARFLTVRPTATAAAAAAAALRLVCGSPSLDSPIPQVTFRDEEADVNIGPNERLCDVHCIQSCLAAARIPLLCLVESSDTSSPAAPPPATDSAPVFQFPDVTNTYGSAAEKARVDPLSVVTTLCEARTNGSEPLHSLSDSLAFAVKVLSFSGLDVKVRATPSYTKPLSVQSSSARTNVVVKLTLLTGRVPNSKDTVSTSPVETKAEGNVAEWVDLGLPVSHLPRGARLGVAIVRVSSTAESVLGWANVQLFSDDGSLKSGTVVLRLWPPVVAGASGSFDTPPESLVLHGAAGCQRDSAATLVLELPELPSPVYYSPLSVPDEETADAFFADVEMVLQAEVDAAPGASFEMMAEDGADLGGTGRDLATLVNKYRLREVDDPRVALQLWRAVGELRGDPRGLLPILFAVPWTEPKAVALMYRWLPSWPLPECPEDAVTLLGPVVVDPVVRAYAVSALHAVPDIMIERGLASLLTRALNHETCSDSPLSRFLHRAAQSVPICQTIFWNTISGIMEEGVIADRCNAFLGELEERCSKWVHSWRPNVECLAALEAVLRQSSPVADKKKKKKKKLRGRGGIKRRAASFEVVPEDTGAYRAVVDTPMTTLPRGVRVGGQSVAQLSTGLFRESASMLIDLNPHCEALAGGGSVSDGSGLCSAAFRPATDPTSHQACHRVLLSLVSDDALGNVANPRGAAAAYEVASCVTEVLNSIWWRGSQEGATAERLVAAMVPSAAVGGVLARNMTPASCLSVIEQASSFVNWAASVTNERGRDRLASQLTSSLPAAITTGEILGNSYNCTTADFYITVDGEAFYSPPAALRLDSKVHNKLDGGGGSFLEKSDYTLPRGLDSMLGKEHFAVLERNLHDSMNLVRARADFVLGAVSLAIGTGVAAAASWNNVEEVRKRLLVGVDDETVCQKLSRNLMRAIGARTKSSEDTLPLRAVDKAGTEAGTIMYHHCIAEIAAVITIVDVAELSERIPTLENVGGAGDNNNNNNNNNASATGDAGGEGADDGSEAAGKAKERLKRIQTLIDGVHLVRELPVELRLEVFDDYARDMVQQGHAALIYDADGFMRQGLAGLNDDFGEDPWDSMDSESSEDPYWEFEYIKGGRKGAYTVRTMESKQQANKIDAGTSAYGTAPNLFTAYEARTRLVPQNPAAYNAKAVSCILAQVYCEVEATNGELCDKDVFKSVIRPAVEGLVGDQDVCYLSRDVRRHVAKLVVEWIVGGGESGGAGTLTGVLRASVVALPSVTVALGDVRWAYSW